MDNAQVVQTATKIAQMMVLRRKPKITVDTQVPSYAELRAELERLVPQMPELPDIPEEVIRALESAPRKQLPPAPQEHVPAEDAPREVIQIEAEPERQGIGVACIPCTVSHIATCGGLLNEAVRFARTDIASDEVGQRIDQCLAEIAAAERVDLAPENVVSLPEAEKGIAHDAAKRLRDIRHILEWYETPDQLEQAAAEMSKLQHDTGKAWRQARLSRLSPEQQEQLIETAKETAQKLLAAEEEALDNG